MSDSLATKSGKNDVAIPSQSYVKPQRGVEISTVKPKTPYQYALNRISKNSKVKALVEDDYICCLERIIERDFFPDLPVLRANKELRNSGMDTRVKEQILQELEAINNTERVKVENADGTLEYVNLPSLSKFQENYTSEDNKSYDSLLVSNIANRNLEDAWIEHVEDEHNKKMNKIQHLTNEGKKSNDLACTTYRARTNLMFHPESLNKKEFVMPAEIRPQNCRINQSHIDELIVTHMAHKDAVQLNNKEQQRRDNIAIHGLYASGVSNDPEYVYTPKIVAGEAIDASPIVTWGTVGQVDKLEEGVNGTPFNLPNVSERDAIANKLRMKHIMPHGKGKSSLLKKKPSLLKSILARSSASSIDTQLREAYSGRSRRSGSSMVSSMATPLATPMRDSPIDSNTIK